MFLHRIRHKVHKVSFHKISARVKNILRRIKIFERVIIYPRPPKKVSTPSSQVRISVRQLVFLSPPLCSHHASDYPTQTKKFSIHKTLILIHWSKPYPLRYLNTLGYPKTVGNLEHLVVSQRRKAQTLS